MRFLRKIKGLRSLKRINFDFYWLILRWTNARVRLYAMQLSASSKPSKIKIVGGYIRLKNDFSDEFVCLRSSVIEHLSCKQRVEGLTPFAGFWPASVVKPNVFLKKNISIFSKEKMAGFESLREGEPNI